MSHVDYFEDFRTELSNYQPRDIYDTFSQTPPGYAPTELSISEFYRAPSDGIITPSSNPFPSPEDSPKIYWSTESNRSVFTSQERLDKSTTTQFKPQKFRKRMFAWLWISVGIAEAGILSLAAAYTVAIRDILEDSSTSIGVQIWLCFSAIICMTALITSAILRYSSRDQPIITTHGEQESGIELGNIQHNSTRCSTFPGTTQVPRASDSTQHIHPKPGKQQPGAEVILSSKQIRMLDPKEEHDYFETRRNNFAARNEIIRMSSPQMFVPRSYEGISSDESGL